MNFKKKYFFIGFFLFLYLFIAYSLHMDYSNKESTTTMATVNHSGKYFIFVDCVDSKLYLFENNKLIKTYPCAGGKPSTPSPIGTWKIISKGEWTGGFGGRFMGFNCSWGKFGIHGTDEPNSIGWNSSHGCIRMYNKDVRELYNIVPYGTKVKIEDGTFGDFGRGLRVLSTGKYGSDLKRVQEILKKQGYYKGTPHGFFDSATLYAVNEFQRKNKMVIQDRITMDFYKKLEIFEFE